GGRYDPTADAWTATATPSGRIPDPRSQPSAVWTGAEMIVWGGLSGTGSGSFADGGRYDPATNTWAPVSTGAADPSARYAHTAVWTGREMIVWGGYDEEEYADGGRYDPALDSWTPASTAAGVPAARAGHAAVWTGREMIVWGGSDGVAV